MEEDRGLIGGETTGTSVGDQAGHGLAGVDGIEHQTLGAGRQEDRVTSVVGARAVAVSDVRPIEGEASARHRSVCARRDRRHELVDAVMDLGDRPDVDAPYPVVMTEADDQAGLGSARSGSGVHDGPERRVAGDLGRRDDVAERAGR